MHTNLSITRRSFLLLQVVVGDDGAEGCSVVDVADVAGQHTDFVAMSGSHEVLDGVAHAVVAAEACHVDFLNALLLNHGEELLRAGFVGQDGVFVHRYIVALGQDGSFGIVFLDRFVHRLVDRRTLGVLHAVRRPYSSIVLERGMVGRVNFKKQFSSTPKTVPSKHSLGRV